nr:hypothetical protein [uncultured archaeon]AQS33859.1 hypothetical protein [uncultured archaeon]
MAKKTAYHKPHIVGNAMILLVLVIGLIGLYYVYQVSTGRAFMQSPRVDKVIQRIPESCCCSTQAGKLFEVTAQVLKGANEFSRVESCFSECQGPSHSTVANPSILIRPGKCASAV